MGKDNTHPNYIVEMVTKYWPDCTYRPTLVALASPKSRLRRLLMFNMKHNGATKYEIWKVDDYYRNLDSAIENAITTL